MYHRRSVANCAAGSKTGCTTIKSVSLAVDHQHHVAKSFVPVTPHRAAVKHLAVIDFETTGLRAGDDRVIEVAAVILEDGIITATFSELMNPGFRIPSFITGLTGITDAMVRGKPLPEAVMPRLRTFLGDAVCLAHNAAFDQRFFRAEMDRAEEAHERQFICSLLLARRLVREAPNHKLGTLMRHVGLTVSTEHRAHRALADVHMTCALWRHLSNTLQQQLKGHAVTTDLVKAITKKPKNLVESYLTGLAADTQPLYRSIPMSVH